MRRKILKIDFDFFRSIFFCAVFFGAQFLAFSLPQGFSSIKLGMNVDAVKSELKKDMQFGFRGERDVSLAPKSKDVIIETNAIFAAESFLSRCFFQFKDDILVSIIINLNEQKIDRYSIFQTLCQKYGEPEEITPQKFIWRDESVAMSLERPFALKYVDQQNLQNQKSQSQTQKSTYETAKENFLSEL